MSLGTKPNYAHTILSMEWVKMKVLINKINVNIHQSSLPSNILVFWNTILQLKSIRLHICDSLLNDNMFEKGASTFILGFHPIYMSYYKKLLK